MPKFGILHIDVWIFDISHIIFKKNKQNIQKTTSYNFSLTFRHSHIHHLQGSTRILAALIDYQDIPLPAPPSINGSERHILRTIYSMISST